MIIKYVGVIYELYLTCRRLRWHILLAYLNGASRGHGVFLYRA